MINYLTCRRFLGHDPKRLPSMQGGGGGMSSKTYRVLEALKEWYPDTKGIVNAHEIGADTLLIEPLRFWLPPEEGDQDANALLDGLDQYKGRKVLYCSEFTLLRYPPDLRRRVVETCGAITVNCRYLGRLLRYISVYTNHILCDPVPHQVFGFGQPTADRQNRIVATGNVSWEKNVHGLIEVFKALEGKMKRVYIGSAKLWSNSGHMVSHRLEDAVRDNTDIFIEEAVNDAVATEMQQSKYGLWCAYHDTFATAVHEMLMSGLVVTTAPHGLTKELPVTVGGEGAKLVDSVEQLTAMSDEEWTKQSNKNTDWAKTTVSYSAFNMQLRKVLGGL